MRCFEQFINDRNCDMCKLTNNETHYQCKTLYEEKKELKHKLNKIKSECSYKTNCWDEHLEFDGCNKNGHGYGRSAEDCVPKIECEKYTVLNK